MSSLKKIVNESFSMRNKKSNKKCKKHKCFLEQLLSRDDIIKEYCVECSKEKEREEKEKKQKEIQEKKKEVINNQLKRVLKNNYDFRLASYAFCSNELKKVFFEATSNKPGKKGYFFYGAGGLGKTLLSKIIVKNIAHNQPNEGYAFTTFNDLSFNVYSASFQERQAILDVYKECYIIVLDDLGRTSVDKGLFRNFIFSIINHRLEDAIEDKITIITSNISIQQAIQMDLLEADRMKLFKNVVFTGKSNRGQ